MASVVTKKNTPKAKPLDVFVWYGVNRTKTILANFLSKEFTGAFIIPWNEDSSSG